MYEPFPLSSIVRVYKSKKGKFKISPEYVDKFPRLKEKLSDIDIKLKILTNPFEYVTLVDVDNYRECFSKEVEIESVVKEVKKPLYFPFFDIFQSQNIIKDNKSYKLVPEREEIKDVINKLSKNSSFDKEEYDMVILTDNSICEKNEYDNTKKMFRNIINYLPFLKEKGHLICRVNRLNMELSVNILYLISQFFEETVYFRSMLSSPTELEAFIIFKKYSNSNKINIDNKNFLKKVANFEYIDPNFSETIGSGFRLTLHQVNDKIKQINSLNLSNKESIQKINIKESINWCHTHGFEVNDFYKEDRLVNINKSLFPQENINFSKLKISEQGKFSITKPQEADTITSLVIKNSFPGIITDATANVGGNVLSFSKKFKFVNAVEISKLHCDIIKNNLEVYNRKNVKVYCDNYLDVMHSLKQDIIFFDPPWGGKDYKEKNSIILSLSGRRISSIINELKEKAKIFVLKGPFNLDVQELVKETNMRSFIMYKIKNYLLVILKN